MKTSHLKKTLTAQAIIDMANGYLPEDRQITNLKKEDGTADTDQNQRLLNIANGRLTTDIFTEVVDTLGRPDGLYLEVEVFSYTSYEGVVSEVTFGVMLEDVTGVDKYDELLMGAGYEKV